MRKIINIIFLFFIAFITSCNTTNPDDIQVKITVEDVSCTEAWLKITGESGSKLVLYRDEKEMMGINLSSADTIIIDDSLQPAKNYTYRISNLQPASNMPVLVTTMDTTSHMFSFETFTFGELASNQFNDVAIIDENNICAVGKYYLNDTNGQIDYSAYNAIFGNGTEWDEQRILFYTIVGQSNKSPYEISSVFYNNNELWVSMDGDQIVKINGSISTIIPLPISFTINKIWGFNDYMYAIGYNGNLLGSSRTASFSAWKKIESGTAISLTDVFGGENTFICGTSYGGGLILKSNGNSFERFAESKIIPEAKIFKPYLFGTIGSLWVDEKNSLYVGGALLYRYKQGRWEYMKGLPGNKAYQNLNAEYRGYITGIRGNASNDLWICGERNTLQHFNGVSWKQIGEPYNPQSDITWYAIEVKGKIAAAVGSAGSKAVIMIIKRN